MKVTLINPEQSKELFKQWGSFARICYNSEKGKEEQIGKFCFNTGHYSGSRTTYFIFHIEGVSRALTAQLNRHSIGTVINEKSMRYVDFSDAEVTIPPSIQRNKKALEVFNRVVNETKQGYSEIQKYLLEDGIKGEMNNQDARYVCPMGTQTEGMWAFTIEALEHICHKRLCVRSQWEIRNLFKLVKKEMETMPSVHERLVPHCEHLLWCPEGKFGCKKYPTREQLKEKLDDIKDGI